MFLLHFPIGKCAFISMSSELPNHKHAYYQLFFVVKLVKKFFVADPKLKHEIISNVEINYFFICCAISSFVSGFLFENSRFPDSIWPKMTTRICLRLCEFCTFRYFHQNTQARIRMLNEFDVRVKTVSWTFFYL